jgi:hypothetical protein
VHWGGPFACGSAHFGPSRGRLLMPARTLVSRQSSFLLPMQSFHESIGLFPRALACCLRRIATSHWPRRHLLYRSYGKPLDRKRLGAASDPFAGLRRHFFIKEREMSAARHAFASRGTLSARQARLCIVGIGPGRVVNSKRQLALARGGAVFGREPDQNSAELLCLRSSAVDSRGNRASSPRCLTVTGRGTRRLGELAESLGRAG